MSRREVRQRAKELAAKYGYLAYMIERYLVLWGEEETIQFLEACEKTPRTSIRVNTLKADEQSTVRRLEEKGVLLEPIEGVPSGYWADFGDRTPGSLLEYMLGLYYIQSMPSMVVTLMLDPQPDEIVMDMAAAPGGKTTHIAQLMENRGLVIAVEQDRLRIASLESNVYRCGVSCAMVFRGDARKISQMGIAPDRILLDAPCSGEGLLPVDPTRKTSKSMADIRFCATREDELLDAAVRVLKPGGVLVYSTCSIAPEEGEYIVDEVIRRHPDITVVPPDVSLGVEGYTAPYGVEMNPSLRHARRFLPHVHGTEGFFICKLQKEGDDQ